MNIQMLQMQAKMTPAASQSTTAPTTESGATAFSRIMAATTGEGKPVIDQKGNAVAELSMEDVQNAVQRFVKDEQSFGDLLQFVDALLQGASEEPSLMELIGSIFEGLVDETVTFEDIEQLAPLLLDESFVQKLTELVQHVPFLAEADDLLAVLESWPLFEQLQEQLTETELVDQEVEIPRQVIEEQPIEQAKVEVEREPMEPVEIQDIWELIERLTTGEVQEWVEQLPIKEQAQFVVIVQYIQQIASQTDRHAGQEVKLQQLQVTMDQLLSEQAEQVRQQAQPVETKTSHQPLPMSLTSTSPLFIQALTAETEQVSRSEELMKQLQAILKRANFGQTGGMNRLSVRLYPEHLGTLRIEIQEVNGVLSARILASTAQAREMLDRQLHQLRAALMNQNMQVEKIELSQMLQQTERSEREGLLHDERKEQRARQEREKQEDTEENEKTFEEFLIELEEM